MRLQVTYNKSGKILAAMRLPDSEEKTKHYFSIVPDKDESAAIVYVPEEHKHWELLDLCQCLRVDVKAKRPCLRLYEDQKE